MRYSIYYYTGRQIAEFLEETLEEIIYGELKVDDDAPIPDRMAR